MKTALVVVTLSLAAIGMANAMTIAPPDSGKLGALPIVKADVVKKSVVRRPAHRVVRKTVIRH